jgi:hypothetical protein
VAARWSRARLLNELRRVLNQPGVVLRPASLDPRVCSAACQYETEGKRTTKIATILIDHAQDGAVTLVVHELLHPLLDEQLEAFLNAELAEMAIRGIEEGLLKALSKNPREYEKWRNAIACKVEGV